MIDKIEQAKALEVQWGEIREFPAGLAVANHFWPGSSIFHYGPPGSHAVIDFGVVLNNRIVGGVEVKTRRVARDAFDTTILTKHKHDAGRYFNFYFGGPVYAAFVFTDAIGVIDLALPPDSYEIISREQREEPRLHAHYRLDRLTFLTDAFTQVAQAVERLTAGCPD